MDFSVVLFFLIFLSFFTPISPYLIKKIQRALFQYVLHPAALQECSYTENTRLQLVLGTPMVILRADCSPQGTTARVAGPQHAGWWVLDLCGPVAITLG